MGFKFKTSLTIPIPLVNVVFYHLWVPNTNNDGNSLTCLLLVIIFPMKKLFNLFRKSFADNFSTCQKIIISTLIYKSSIINFIQFNYYKLHLQIGTLSCCGRSGRKLHYICCKMWKLISLSFSPPLRLLLSNSN